MGLGISHQVPNAKAHPVPIEKKEIQTLPTRLFRGGRVLGDGLRALRHGVLGQLTGQDKAHRRLDLSAGDGRLLVVGSQLGSLGGDSLEDV